MSEVLLSLKYLYLCSSTFFFLVVEQINLPFFRLLSLLISIFLLFFSLVISLLIIMLSISIIQFWFCYILKHLVG